MNKKKLFSLLLTCSFLASAITPAVAMDTSAITVKSVSTSSSGILKPEGLELSKEEALKKSIELLQKHFSIKVNETDFKYNISLDTLSYEASSGKRVWSIQWYQNSYKKNINIYLTLDAVKGNIIYMSKNDYNNNSQYSVPTLSIEEAEKIAADVAKKLNPDEFKQCVLSNNKWFSNRGNSSSYSFNYVRTMNGASYANNNIYINVDGTSGAITSYNCNWNSELSAPKTETYLPSLMAQSVFKDNMNVTLKYKLFKNKYEYQNAENEKNVKLVYEPTLKDGFTIDAKTGKFINTENVDNSQLESAALSATELQKLYSKYIKIEDTKTPLEETKALSLIETSVKNLYGEGYTISDLRYSENDNKIWSAYFSKKIDEKNVQSGSISIDALNGQILYITNYRPYEYKEKFTPKFTWKEGYNKAIDLIGDYYKDKIKDIELTQVHTEAKYYETEPERYYRYSFVRKVNNIPFENNNVYVEFNAETGEISSMRSSWDKDIVFPDPSKSITTSKAKEAYFSKYKPALNYIVVNTSSDEKNYVPGLKLVYSLDQNNVFINGFDENILNSYDGEEVKFDITEFLNEIKGSNAEKEIKILAYKGLIDTDNFKLKAQVKNIDLIRTLVDALGYTPYIINDSTANMADAKKEASDTSSAETLLSDEDYLKMASYYGIIAEDVDKIDLQANVTKITMTKALIRFLQYDKIAQIPDIFTLNFKDAKSISTEDIGYIALARGLNLVSLDTNNNFNPKAIVTKEELALSVFRTLQNQETSSNTPYPIFK